MFFSSCVVVGGVCCVGCVVAGDCCSLAVVVVVVLLSFGIKRRSAGRTDAMLAPPPTPSLCLFSPPARPEVLQPSHQTSVSQSEPNREGGGCGGGGGRAEEKYLTESYTKRGHSEFLTFFTHGRFKKRRRRKKRVGWRGREEQLLDGFLFILLSFLLFFFSALLFRETEASARPQLTHPCVQGLAAGP